jgi:hypothetical protein
VAEREVELSELTDKNAAELRDVMSAAAEDVDPAAVNALADEHHQVHTQSPR